MLKVCACSLSLYLNGIRTGNIFFTMNESSITKIIDKHLQKSVDRGSNMLPAKIEAQMTHPNEGPDNDGWQRWYPIKSIVTDNEILKLEQTLGHRLPDSYKLFLKHRHFYELYISEARFSGHQIRGWKQYLIDMAFDGYPRELLIDRGYIPFADWYDWGMLCFDTNRPNEKDEYPIVLWDHDRWDQYEAFSDNFYELLVKLDRESVRDQN